jgi:hypothetical protein
MLVSSMLAGCQFIAANEEGRTYCHWQYEPASVKPEVKKRRACPALQREFRSTTVRLPALFISPPQADVYLSNRRFINTF